MTSDLYNWETSRSTAVNVAGNWSLNCSHSFKQRYQRRPTWMEKDLACCFQKQKKNEGPGVWGKRGRPEDSFCLLCRPVPLRYWFQTRFSFFEWTNWYSDQRDAPVLLTSNHKDLSVDSSSHLSPGYYLHMEASPMLPGQSARLLSRPVRGGRAPQCLQFFYHMYGSGTGALRVLLNEEGQETLLWQQSREQSIAWLRGQVQYQWDRPHKARQPRLIYCRTETFVTFRQDFLL